MKRFKIPKIPDKTNVSISFSISMVENIYEFIEDTDYTFRTFIEECIIFALEDLKEQKENIEK